MKLNQLKRREFISPVGSAAAAWPLAARAQQPNRVRRIGILSGFSERDPFMIRRLASFRQRLKELGWTDGRNIHIYYYRWSAGETDQVDATAAELVSSNPDVILAHTSNSVIALRRQTRTGFFRFACQKKAPACVPAAGA